MKILVIMTGGTIACSEKEHVRSLDAGAGGLLMDLYRRTDVFDESDEFEITSPISILSETLSAADINTLVSEIRSRLGSSGDIIPGTCPASAPGTCPASAPGTCGAPSHTCSYDGIIVTHGSDTLQYTAAALSFAFGTDCIPIMLVCSNHPLDNPLANGLDNFCAAVSFIRNSGQCGVFVPYRNDPSGPVHMHPGYALLTHCESMHEVFSPDPEDLLKPAPTGEPVLLSERSGILVVSPYPGAAYDYGDLSSYRCVLLKPYHSATLNTASSDFIRFCRQARDAGLPMYLSGCPDGAMYESASAYAELGISTLPYSTFAVAYMRLWIDNSNRSGN